MTFYFHFVSKTEDLTLSDPDQVHAGSVYCYEIDLSFYYPIPMVDLQMYIIKMYLLRVLTLIWEFRINVSGASSSEGARAGATSRDYTCLSGTFFSSFYFDR